MVFVRFMTLSGKFTLLREARFATTAEATKAVEAHAAEGGFTHVKMIDDGDPCSYRYTARTPGGRGGRNVAFLDLE